MKKVINIFRIFFCTILVLYYCTTLSAQEQISPSFKSLNKAVVLSTVSTLGPSLLSLPFILSDDPESNWNEAVGIGLISAGFIFGPGIGHRYADNNRTFWYGALIRSLGGGLFLLGIDQYDSINDDSSGGDVLVTIGGGIVLVSIIRDIVKADGSARKYNYNYGVKKLSFYPSIQSESGTLLATISMHF